MDDICRLCCSRHFVNNYIFDEENALYLKMSLYLPIKVFKNDRLPQKICDKCSCKVNDFYQFCNESIEVQNRLNHILISSKLDDNERFNFTNFKENVNSIPLTKTSQGTQTEIDLPLPSVPTIKTEPKPVIEPEPEPEIKKECDYFERDDFSHAGVPSDSSEEELLIEIKKKKRNKKENSVTSNGEVKVKRAGKRKTKLNDEELPSQTLENGLTVVKEVNESSVDLNHVTEEVVLRPQELGKVVPAAKWAGHWRRHFKRDTHPYRCALCEVTYRDHLCIMKHGQCTTPTMRSGRNTSSETCLTHGADDPRREEGARPDMRVFVCDLCPEGFYYMRCLLAHRTRAHPEAAARALQLRCGVCDRSFTHANSLRRHSRVHSGERNYLCNVCGKALTSREHLKFHIRIHTGYKPNICKTCGKGFAKKCNLKLHERVHSGEKPYVCSHCGKAFSQRSTLVIHERYHSGARPFSCSLCGRGFVARGLLTMHLKSACVDLPRPHPPPAPAQQRPLKCVH
ncbi:gastrula zinc finger protein XlCGF26.1-like, partial [Melitaea cinxia]|uniref:gastrula zinc finger protein XlCGF26.1-like n=1 Tax=Melitaea cinxia TaxID=113334 RepID=UPI001E2720F8